MNTHTIIDSNGEVVSVLTCRSLEALALNQPENTTAVEGPPPQPDAYRVNNNWVARPAKPTQYHTWNVVNKVWEDIRPLDKVRTDWFGKLKTEAWLNNNNTITLAGYVFDADVKAKDAIYTEAQAILTSGSTANVLWTLHDNTQLSMTVNQFKNFATAVHDRSKRIHEALQVLRAGVNNASREEVASFVWTTIV